MRWYQVLQLACRDQLDRLVRVWELYQVELHGSYSLERLRAVSHHIKTSSRVRNVAMMISIPLPCLVVVIVFDVLPLRPTSLPFWSQTPWVVVRYFFLMCVIGFTLSHQIRSSSPTLPLSMSRQAAIILGSALVTSAFFVLLASNWTYPVPLALNFAVLPWLPTFSGLLWWSWKNHLVSDSVARNNLKRYLHVFVAQVVTFMTYTAFVVAFKATPVAYQSFISLCFPVLKLIFKNWASHGVYHMEDLAPILIVLNFDVFHAVFVSTTTQQAGSWGTIGVIMVVDVVQSLVAYREIVGIVRQVNRLAATSQSPQSPQREASVKSSRPISQIASALDYELKAGLVDFTMHLTDTCKHLRDHPLVSQPRHLRTRPESTNARVFVMPANPIENFFAPASHSARLLTEREQAQVDCVAKVLKMLHMLEFYVLVEYIEVAVAAGYTLYTFALSLLPNHVYYTQMKQLSDAEIAATAVRLAQYSMLELLSFVVFCVAVDRQLQHVSTTRQLAFVLQRHWNIIQPSLLNCVFLAMQLSFEHFGWCRLYFLWLRSDAEQTDGVGPDYTFKFDWMKPA